MKNLQYYFKLSSYSLVVTVKITAKKNIDTFTVKRTKNYKILLTKKYIFFYSSPPSLSVFLPYVSCQIY